MLTTTLPLLTIRHLHKVPAEIIRLNLTKLPEIRDHLTVRRPITAGLRLKIKAVRDSSPKQEGETETETLLLPTMTCGVIARTTKLMSCAMKMEKFFLVNHIGKTAPCTGSIPKMKTVTNTIKNMMTKEMSNLYVMLIKTVQNAVGNESLWVFRRHGIRMPMAAVLQQTFIKAQSAAVRKLIKTATKPLGEYN